MEDNTKLETDAITTYILAGNATVTLENPSTGGRFTYRISAPSEKTSSGGNRRLTDAKVRFVKLLTGPDNESDYKFFGTIFDGKAFKFSEKSSFSPTAPGVLAWRWVWNRLSAGLPIEPVVAYHSGRCGRCGRRLTVPESIKRGIGPECAEREEG